MTGYEFGEIVLVPFPFTDQSATKHRPAVVISSTAYHRAHPDLIIMAVTSQQPTSDALGKWWPKTGGQRDCSSHMCSNRS